MAFRVDVQHENRQAVAYQGDDFAGIWYFPETGSPHGEIDVNVREVDQRTDVYDDYMEWLYAAMGGFPKAWVEDKATSLAYFLVGSDTLLGYAYVLADNTPGFLHDAGLTDDPAAWTPADVAFQVQAHATLTEAARLVPSLTTHEVTR